MKPLRAAARGLGELMVTLGVVLLLFLAWQLWWTDLTASRVQNQLTHELQSSWQPPHPGATTTAGPTAAPTTPVEDPPLSLRDGQAFALIHIPRFGKGYVRPVLQGVELPVLDRGVGHYPDSADPGAVGNFAVAGHRVTYAKPFNLIAELQPGDPIVVETRTAWFVYRVQRHVIVTPDRVDVIAPVPENPKAEPTERMMTMTACHPMFSARERYVVFSRLETRIPKTAGVVPDVLK
ncbi:MAG TPA: class E sortase [Angustibacter sp.]|nr:class E sortase [Angustibacter sp.]